MRIVSMLFVLFMLSVNSYGFDRYTAHGGPIKGLAYSADLGLMVSTSFDYTAVIWDAGTMQELKQLIGHDAAVNAAAFSPDGRWLATAGDDNQILLWETAQLRDPQYLPTGIPLIGHTAKIVHLAFSGDGKYLASSSWDRRIGLWDVETLSIKQFLTSHKVPVNAAQFSRDGKLLFSGVLMDTFASGGSRLASSSGVLSGTVLELM